MKDIRTDKLEKVVRMVQRYFLNSWLLPCSLRSHRTANPRPKIGFAIFRLCPPTTRQVGGIRKFAIDLLVEKIVYSHSVKQCVRYSKKANK